MVNHFAIGNLSFPPSLSSRHLFFCISLVPFNIVSAKHGNFHRHRVFNSLIIKRHFMHERLPVWAQATGRLKRMACWAIVMIKCFNLRKHKGLREQFDQVSMSKQVSFIIYSEKHEQRERKRQSKSDDRWGNCLHWSMYVTCHSIYSHNQWFYTSEAGMYSVRCARKVNLSQSTVNKSECGGRRLSPRCRQLRFMNDQWSTDFRSIWYPLSFSSSGLLCVCFRLCSFLSCAFVIQAVWKLSCLSWLCLLAFVIILGDRQGGAGRKRKRGQTVQDWSRIVCRWPRRISERRTSAGQFVNSLLFSLNENAKNVYVCMRQGKWSEWLARSSDGNKMNAFFARCQLISLCVCKATFDMADHTFMEKGCTKYSRCIDK